ncbi:hypothetical protein Celaphus_00008864 [Cervus elaphus hippelaphus]|uniref:Uncharacterized protein n=1 Tax=Cervus elaphus hippelaphus TaxID=46360 RepID=A0A212DI83_CEREH|nr:hypothetical protein Celaphus_00008864 [Cervus elaphus hippelaphus]
MSIHWCCTRNSDCYELQVIFQKHGTGSPICFRCFSWCYKQSRKNWWCF